MTRAMNNRIYLQLWPEVLGKKGVDNSLSAASGPGFLQPEVPGKDGVHSLLPIASRSDFPWPEVLGKKGVYSSLPVVSCSRFPWLEVKYPEKGCEQFIARCISLRIPLARSTRKKECAQFVARYISFRIPLARSTRKKGVRRAMPAPHLFSGILRRRLKACGEDECEVLSPLVGTNTYRRLDA
jgi:hypothetical protein